jgi:uncharacterized membrane protein YczE
MNTSPPAPNASQYTALVVAIIACTIGVFSLGLAMGMWIAASMMHHP